MGHGSVQFGMGQGAARAVFETADQGDAVIAAAQQVLGEVEPRAGKPVRAREAFGMRQHLLAGL